MSKAKDNVNWFNKYLTMTIFSAGASYTCGLLADQLVQYIGYDPAQRAAEFDQTGVTNSDIAANMFGIACLCFGAHLGAKLCTQIHKNDISPTNKMAATASGMALSVAKTWSDADSFVRTEITKQQSNPPSTGLF